MGKFKLDISQIESYYLSKDDFKEEVKLAFKLLQKFYDSKVEELTSLLTEITSFYKLR